MSTLTVGTATITGPFQRDAGKGRSTKMQWIANVRRGSLLDVIVLCPLTNEETGEEVTRCEAAELMEAMAANLTEVLAR